MQSIKQIFRRHSVAIISLTVAITALCYDTWRNEETEKNRNIRVASFEILKNLEQLQLIVNSSHFEGQSSKVNPFSGWEHVALITDLSMLLPEPFSESADKLLAVWKDNWSDIKTNESSVDKITHEIDNSRQTILQGLRSIR